MPVDWIVSDVRAFRHELESRTHSHVGFVVGSAVSCDPPTQGLSVGEVRRHTIAAIRRTSLGKTAPAAVISLLSRIERALAEPCHEGRKIDWQKVLEDLPFEQFMACVAHASAHGAENIARVLCGTGSPNANHKAVAGLCRKSLLEYEAHRVTVATTNYDLGLDRALQAEFGDPTVVGDTPLAGAIHVQRFEVGKQVLTYVKLHGCIRRPASLVFTFGQMIRLLTMDWALELLGKIGGRASLVLSIGYGFWDRDLDEFFKNWLNESALYRNVRPCFKDDATRTPAAVLQDEFFRDLPVRSRHLMRADFRRVLAALNDVSEKVDVSRTDYSVRELIFDVALSGHWSLDATGRFLGRLCHCAEQRRGRRALLSLLPHMTTPHSCTDVAHEYLRTIGVRDQRRRMVICSQMLRRPYPWSGGRPFRLPRGVLAVARSYESFARSLMVTQAEGLRRTGGLGLHAFVLLMLGYISSLRLRYARSICDEYGAHFWVKGFQQIPSAAFRQVVLRSIVAPAMRRRVALLEQACDLDRSGDAAALLAEVLIQVRASNALTQANRARRWRTVIGRYSNAAQGYRLLGWAHLAQDHRVPAIGAFAVGVELALERERAYGRESGERGVMRKVGANLIRVAWRECKDSWRYLQPTQQDDEDVISALECIKESVMMEGCTLADVLREAEKEWQTVCEYVYWSFQSRWKELIAELDQYEDTYRHPIYYPRCEP